MLKLTFNVKELDFHFYNYENTPLHEASGKGYLEIVKYLIDIGADINIEDRSIISKLVLCLINSLIIKKHLFIVHLRMDISRLSSTLLKKEQMLMPKNQFVKKERCYFSNQGTIPLHNASYKGHLEIVEYLIEKGANVNCESNIILKVNNAISQIINILPFT